MARPSLVVLFYCINFLLWITTSNADDTVEHDSVHSDISLAAQLSTVDTRKGLVWSDLSVSTDSGTILVHPFSGSIGNGQLTGVLGPSGSGKSTLCKALAKMQTLPLAGQVWSFSAQEVPSSNKPTTVFLETIPPHQVAWLQQQDSFFELLTVRETLQLAAYLELPHLDAGHRNQLVQTHLDALGLAHTAERHVGGAQDSSAKGSSGNLSGGERRRLSVALELLTEKDIFVADEPTSGLDASMSAKVVALLHDLVLARNIPCLVVLHQPRSSIWRRLENIILMGPGGRVCYAGKRTNVVAHFADLGYPCPTETNPAEFLVDLVSIDTEDPEQAEKDRERIQGLARAFRRQQLELEHQSKSMRKVNVVIRESSDRTNRREGKRFIFGWVRRFAALLQRSWRQNIRNVSTNSWRMVASGINALLLTAIFPTVRGAAVYANSIADRVAMLTFASVILANMAYLKAADLFAQEKPVVQREQTRQQYSTFEYLVAKASAELPLDASFAVIFSSVLKLCSGLRISWALLSSSMSLLTVASASIGFFLSSILPPNIATTGGLPVMVLLMCVGVINPSGVDPDRPPPQIVRAMKNLSPFRYVIEALCVGEYSGLRVTRSSGWFSGVTNLGGLAMLRNGAQILGVLGLQSASFGSAMRSMAWLSVANLSLTWVGLAFERRRQNHSRSRRRKTSDNEPLDQTTNLERVELSSTKSSPLQVVMRVKP